MRPIFTFVTLINWFGISFPCASLSGSANARISFSGDPIIFAIRHHDDVSLSRATVHGVDVELAPDVVLFQFAE